MRAAALVPQQHESRLFQLQKNAAKNANYIFKYISIVTTEHAVATTFQKFRNANKSLPCELKTIETAIAQITPKPFLSFGLIAAK